MSSLFFALRTPSSRSGFTAWRAAKDYNSGEKLFANVAKNGQTLHVKFGRGEPPHTLGVFYGRNRHKSLVRHWDLIEPGNWKQWVFAACDIIGDQSSVIDLQVEAMWQGYIHKQAEALKVAILPFDLFENYIKEDLGAIYELTVAARLEWRRENNVVRDCRTYSGQPERNMRRMVRKARRAA